jgi:hypothetical protein
MVEEAGENSMALELDALGTFPTMRKRRRPFTMRSVLICIILASRHHMGRHYQRLNRTVCFSKHQEITVFRSKFSQQDFAAQLF